MTNKKVAVFTGTRAEYGLLYWIIKDLQDSPVDLQLMVGGTHLSSEFGNTVEQIVNDGFTITDTLEFLLSSDSPVGISKSLGLAVISAAECFARNKPDILVLLGDRYESLAIAQAAMINGVPIAHIHGGELTEALIDDSIRHSITKMSQIHFTSTEKYRQRVIQLGEQPDTVFNYGAPGIDNIKKLSLLNLEELSASINIKLDAPFFLVTYHPVTLVKGQAEHELQALLNVLDEFPEFKVIITYPNADTYGRHLIQLLSHYRGLNPNRVILLSSMGQIRYLSAMKLSSLVIGNSSSGIIEAPSCNVATVNIGDRQKGRISADSVIHCSGEKAAIRSAITFALSSSFQSKVAQTLNPYGEGNSSSMIVNHIVNYSMSLKSTKVFYDVI